MPNTARHLHIHGHVQGVGYRWSMVREAARLGLRGWVRNRRDGSVEAVVAGAAEAVEAMVSWARRGPPSAAVARVDVSECDEVGFQGFEQRPTA
jgi:acylphosphatase